ncbi:MAG: xanthine dehydrogenase family protein [Phycisphaerales bacterium]|nr:xanthine dehydrogenase family protein [Phycisphaerales bacterium]
MRRLEGISKLSGRERYVDDLPCDGALWGMTVRSPSPRGRIRSIEFGPGVEWSQFVVVDHRDIPGPNEVFLIERDQPVLASDYVRHMHEPILLIAHEDRAMCRAAVKQIRIIIDEQPAALDYRVLPASDQVQRGQDNVLKTLKIEKGDVEHALAEAAHVVEGVYETGAQEHIYIENQGMLAWVEQGVVVTQGSMQCPYYVVNALKHALARDESQVRVIQAPTGGGFGGKEDYPSHLALHAALLALKANRPVKMIYDRSEDMAATTKRHPAQVRHRTGFDASGKLVAQAIDVVMDGGAYVTLSPVVLSRGIIHAAGPYACDNVRIAGRAMLTNAVPFGAFRGFGAPQTLFALERHMDVCAETLGIDPIDLRRMNLIRDGQETATGQVINDGADRERVLDLATKHIELPERREQHATFNITHPFLRRGIGLAMFFHGAGFTGSGEVALQSRVRVAGLKDGRIEVLASSTEMGQGTLTVFTKIAAERLGIDPSQVLIATPDTARVPNSGPTVASRTSMVVGRLVERACDALLEQAGLSRDARGERVQQAIRAWHVAHPNAQLSSEATYERPPGVQWDDNTYRGDAYGTYAWAAYAAEVEVDLRTFTARVIDFVAVQDVGKVLHETLARGQIQGGVVQAIGWALLEECVWERGGMKNCQLTNYIIPTSDDVPPIRVYWMQTPYAHGAQGAKGIGELPMDGPGPAIANAIANAIGVEANVLPLTPERLMQMMDGAHV